MNHKQIAALATALEGVPVWGCLPGSPSHEAGIRAGDILLEVNGLRVKDVGDYIKARGAEPTDMTVRLFRDGEEMTFECSMRATEAVDIADVVKAVRIGKMIPLNLQDDEFQRPS